LGKACDLIDQHQHNKRSASITSLTSKEIQNKRTNNQTAAVTKTADKLCTPPNSPTSDATNSYDLSFLSPNSFNENFPRQRRKHEDMNKIPIANYLSGSASPINTKSKETTCKELKDSAILLENKIEALFGKSRGVKSDDVQSKSPLNATSDGIFFATEYVEIEHKASCVETNAEQCVFETTSKYIEDMSSKLKNNYEPANQSIELLETSSISDLNDSISKSEYELKQENIIPETNENEATIHSTPLKGDVQLSPNDNTVSKKYGVKTNETEQIGWSKRRSQLLAAKQAQTDSRRRPLSCTPPSTSMDQSSIDEEEDSSSISLQTASYSSSVISSATNTSSNDKVSASYDMKHADCHGFSRSPSSSFEGLTTTNLENENMSAKDECNQSSVILRVNDMSKPDQIIVQRDTALKSIAEKENENLDTVETSNPVGEILQEVELPDICQQEQPDQHSSTKSCSGEKLNDCSMEE